MLAKKDTTVEDAHSLTKFTFLVSIITQDGNQIIVLPHKESMKLYLCILYSY